MHRSRTLRGAMGTIAVLMLVAGNVPSLASPCPGANIVVDPPEFQWTYHPATASNPEAYYSGVMEIGEATFTIGGETLTTRAYRQAGGSYTIPGPTMTVVPGNKYVLSFHNTLPYEPLSPEMNVLKDPNVSNLHTHGLHISGESPGDDVTRSFEGGHGGDFVYDIPADHMGGTYWYHAHHHGSTFLQVSGGAFGLLLVDDSADGMPANVAAMTERQIVLGFLDPAAAGAGGDVLMGGTLSPTWTVNGLVEGNICMPPDTWQHWRVLLADRDARAKDIEFGPECEVLLLARDGVWRTAAPREIASNLISITGASRADFAIRISGDSQLSVDGTVVANIFADGTPDPTPHPYDTDGVSMWSAVRPDYLRDLRNESNVNFESVSMGARTINGGKFDHDVPTFTLPADQVQEWSVSGAVNHPFHLHVYHVQALVDDKGFEAGEYYDVIAARMSVRFDLSAATSSPYEGRTILHCHILGHEDRGAMGWLDVIGGAAPPTYPLDGNLPMPYSEYYSLDGGGPVVPNAPSDLTATAVSSTTINLTWVDNALNEDGFNIERSLDGVAFELLASVGPDVVAYSDGGLSASTTYYYRVSGYNAVGSSAPSNVASATTFPTGGGQQLHVESIVVTREQTGGSRLRGVVVVTILDQMGSPVSGARVDGEFTGPTSASRNGTTDANGQVTLTSKANRNPVGEWCFRVTDISLDGATYDPTANVMTEACESGPLRMAATPDPGFRLLGAQPNPFVKTTTIVFDLPAASPVVLEVYSVRGERLAVLAEGWYGSGRHVVDWNVENLASGIYMCRLKANGSVATHRLALVR